MDEHEVMDFAIQVSDITNDLAYTSMIRFALEQFRSEGVGDYLDTIEEMVDSIEQTLEDRMREEWKDPPV